MQFLATSVQGLDGLWHDTLGHAIGYAEHRSRSHHAVIRVYAAAGNVIENVFRTAQSPTALLALARR